MSITLTEAEKQRFIRWVIENLDGAAIVPSDEGNDRALLYNIVHWIRGDDDKYDYKPEQDAEIQSFFDT
jgi:hypothetical protein